MTFDRGINDRLLTVKEIATLTTFSEHSIRRWIKQGLLDVERVGPYGRIRVKLSVVRRFFPNVPTVET